MKKLLVFILALIMLFSVFACTKNEGKKPADTTVPGTTAPGTTEGETTPEETTEPDVTIKVENDALDLPEMKFNGKKLRISGTNDAASIEIFSDETAITIREQALWVRNEKIQDKYDVKIEPLVYIPSEPQDHPNTLLENIMSGDDLFDLAMTKAHVTSILLISGYLVNWQNMQYNNFSKLYWRSDINEKFTFDDALYTPVGDMCISVLTNTYAMFYNRTKGDQLYVDEAGTVSITEDVFARVDDMTWTMDYFMGLVSNIYSDLDYEIGRSAGDFYGFTSNLLTDLDIWQFAFDIPMIEADRRKVFKLVFDSEKAVTMVDKLTDLYWESNGSYCTNETDMFVTGKALFTPAWLGKAISIYKNMEDDYSILPYPMWDEDQEQYLTGAMDNYNVLCVPTTSKNLDMVSYIVEVLNYESRETLYPVYYEESLKKQAVRDPESVEMLDLVVNGCTFDIGTMFYHAADALPIHVRNAVSYQRTFKEVYDDRGSKYDFGIKDLAGKYRRNKNNGAK